MEEQSYQLESTVRALLDLAENIERYALAQKDFTRCDIQELHQLLLDVKSLREAADAIKRWYLTP